MLPGGYHILLVPQNAEKTRRFRLSSLTARLLALAGLLVVPLIVGSLFSTIHFQNKVVALKRRMANDHQILEEKEILATRLASLERSLGRTERSLSKLERVLDVDVGQMTGGVGPLDVGLDLSQNSAEIPMVESSLDALLEQGSNLDLRGIRGKMVQLDRRIGGLDSTIDEIFELNEDKIRLIGALPDVMPVDGWITSDFGFRRSPYSGRHKMHYGIDIASPLGSTVRAPADGTVLLAEYKGGYGRKVILDHDYGVTTVFGHASELFVKEGQSIKKGQPIAAVGSSGASTGPHLHYEIHVDGIPTNPLTYMKE